MSDDPGSVDGPTSDQPVDGKAQIERARLLLESGQVEEAVALYVLIAEGHATSGAPFYAIAGYRRVLKHAPRHPSARERIGDLYLSMGFPDEAAAELLTALEERRAAGDGEGVARLTGKIDALAASKSS